MISKEIYNMRRIIRMEYILSKDQSQIILNKLDAITTKDQNSIIMKKLEENVEQNITIIDKLENTTSRDRSDKS
jgi:hypothetical protein